jgi:Zn-dependent M28 family amino/carboxypeptidase
MAVRAEMRELSAANVAGLLPGSDPARSGEVVVVVAHLDGLGVGEPRGGDAIHNGAMDNASGVAAMLEVARGLASAPRAPPRSVLFLAVTAEEKGLLGSEWFAAHPTVPLDRIVAVLNVDGAPGPFPFEDVVARGAGHSTLGRAAALAAEAAGVPVSPDPAPRANAFIRSDQYSFVRAGIPSLYVTPGRAGGDPEARRRWARERYHTPADEWDPGWNWEGAARFARLQLLLALAVASGPDRPRWNPGDVLAPRAGR